jgi:hypothetical protein
LQNNDFSKFCCNKTKTCSVLTKFEEQEDLLLTLISKIENPELKEEYLKELKKTMIKDANKPSKSKISLDGTLERFSKQKSKVATILDLQHEISNIKKDIVDLKKDLHNLKIDNKNLEQEFLISKLKNCFQEHNSEDNESKHSYKGESSNNLISNDVKIISLINKIILPKWYVKVHIIVAQDYTFNNKIVDIVCFELPNAFWYRKKHIVSLLYVKYFSEKKIPTKAKPIQMNAEILDFCQKEIADLLAKGIIRKSKSS